MFRTIEELADYWERKDVSLSAQATQNDAMGGGLYNTESLHNQAAFARINARYLRELIVYKEKEKQE